MTLTMNEIYDEIKPKDGGLTPSKKLKKLVKGFLKK